MTRRSRSTPVAKMGQHCPMPPYRPTMRDVATASGVAIKTVSRVMNGEPNVAPETAERVRAAAAGLGYVLHQQAAELRRRDGATRAVGLLLASVSNTFDSQVHGAVERVAKAAGLTTLAASTEDDPQLELEALTAFLGRRIDGLIISTIREDHMVLAREVERGWPVVFVDRAVDDLACDTVTVDNRGGIRTAVRHLRASGHRRIAFLGNKLAIRTSRERLAGFDDETRDDPDCVRITDLVIEHDVVSAVEDLLARPDAPTALVSARNDISIATMRTLQRLGRQHTTALVGFDDVPLADLVDPGLTVIAQDPEAVGELSARRLLARLGGDVSPTQRIVLSTRLIPRGSGEIPPV